MKKIKKQTNSQRVKKIVMENNVKIEPNRRKSLPSTDKCHDHGDGMGGGGGGDFTLYEILIKDQTCLFFYTRMPCGYLAVLTKLGILVLRSPLVQT